MEHTRLGLNADNHPVSLTLQQRLWQIAVLGKTGMGKSTVLRSIIAQDIARGDGLLLIDPHGTLAEECLALVPLTENRRNQVCVFDLSDTEYPVAFNVLADVHPDERELVAEGIVSAMYTVWGDISWGPQLERILRNSLIVLLDSPGTSFVHIPRFLTDPVFRERIVSRATNPVARDFFQRAFVNWSQEFVEQSISPVLNKVEAFTVNRKIRNVLGQEKSKLHFEHALGHSRIVIAKLAKGSVGDKPASLTGSFLLARALSATMARERQPKENHRPFHIIIDEAKNFGPRAIADLLTDGRKFKVSVTVATQFLDSLEPEAQQAVLGSTGTLVCFRLGPDDAKHLAPLFDREHQQFNPHVLYNLELGEAWCRGSFLYPDDHPLNFPNPENVRKQSRRHYSRPRHVVEQEIARIFAHTIE
jgi:DNA helicase HerA-like ATPase